MVLVISLLIVGWVAASLSSVLVLTLEANRENPYTCETGIIKNLMA